MLRAFSEIHWIGVLVAFVASSVLGGVYFGALVPRAYLRVLGREGQTAPKSTAVTAVGPLVCGFVVVLASAVLVAALGLTTALDAVVFGLVVGIGFLVAMTFQIAINPQWPRPPRRGHWCVRPERMGTP